MKEVLFQLVVPGLPKRGLTSVSDEMMTLALQRGQSGEFSKHINKQLQRVEVSSHLQHI